MFLCWWGLLWDALWCLKISFQMHFSVACVTVQRMSSRCLGGGAQTGGKWPNSFCQPPDNHQFGLPDSISLKKSLLRHATKKVLSLFLAIHPLSCIQLNPQKKKKKGFESFNAFWWWSYVSWRLFNESFWSSVLTYLMALRQKAALLSLSTKQILQSNLILRRCVWEAVRGIWSVVHSAERPNLYPVLTVYRPKLSCQLFPSACQATHTPPPVP